MGSNARKALIEKIEKERGSKVICFLTSVRPGVPGVIAGDQVRVFFDHLLLFKDRPVEKLDIFLCSNGGESTVPWRLVALFREFCKSYCVLIPYRAYSAATLLTLGADEIVMHPFAELGPIDPNVSNEFNPKVDGQRIGINVEDVTAYINFIKSTCGITHEDELIKAIEALTKEVNPLALGNVERFIMQSRMIARKIMKTHMKESDDHSLDEIIETMASKLYFHGHPINRVEARNDLKLKVAQNVKPEFESLMWELYKDFEIEFNNVNTFNPAADLIVAQDLAAKTIAEKLRLLNDANAALSQAKADAQTLASKVPALHQKANTLAQVAQADPGKVALAQEAQQQAIDADNRAGEAASIVPERQAAVEIATGKLNLAQQELQLTPTEKSYELCHAMIESLNLSSKMTTTRRYKLTQAPVQFSIHEDVQGQGWIHSPAAKA